MKIKIASCYQRHLSNIRRVFPETWLVCLHVQLVIIFVFTDAKYGVIIPIMQGRHEIKLPAAVIGRETFEVEPGKRVRADLLVVILRHTPSHCPLPYVTLT